MLLGSTSTLAAPAAATSRALAPQGPAPDCPSIAEVNATPIAERWAVLSGLPGEEALQCVTWQLNRRWSFTALRANARVRIECAHLVTYHQAGGGSGVAPRSVGRTHSGWLSRQRPM